MVSNYTNFCWFIKGTNILKLQKYRKYTVQELHGTTWDSLGRRADKAWAVTTRSNKSLEAKRDCLLVTRDGLSKTQIAWESTSSGIARLNSFNRTHSLVWCMSVTLSQGGCKVWWGWWWSGSYGRQTFPALRQLVGLVIQVELPETKLSSFSGEIVTWDPGRISWYVGEVQLWFAGGFSRVAGGEPSAFGEWPHACSILRYTPYSSILRWQKLKRFPPNKSLLIILWEL